MIGKDGRKVYFIAVTWNTGEATYLNLEAWDMMSAKILALAQFPVTLHDRLIVECTELER